MKNLLIRNASYVVTGDEQNTVLQDVDILIRDGTIQHIGYALDMDAQECIDASGKIVYPGLVNTHHHFYQVLTRNIPEIQKLELFDWLRWLYERWRNLTPDMLHAASLLAMADLIRFGCTTAVDHHYVFPRGQDGLIDTQFEAAERLGMRLYACRGSMSRGVSDGGLPPDDLVQAPQKILQDSERLIRTHHQEGKDAMRGVILAPCSPFSVDDGLMRDSAALGREYGVRLHTHLAETKDEVDYCLQTVGMRPLAYMASLDWTGPDVFFAHGIYFEDEEIDLLAHTKTGVAHCPVSNMKLSSGIARVTDLLAAGVPVGLAVDGSASNDASNLLAELRSAYLLQRLRYGDRAPDAARLLRMAAQGGASLLGRKDLGVLREGYAADLFLVDANNLSIAGCLDDPAAIPGTVGISEPVWLTMIAGQVVWRDDAFPDLDVVRLTHRVNEHCKRMR